MEINVNACVLNVVVHCVLIKEKLKHGTSLIK